MPRKKLKSRSNVESRVRREQRVTRPAAGNFPDATFDYILYRGFDRIVGRKIYSGAGVSDHNLVALRLR